MDQMFLVRVPPPRLLVLRPCVMVVEDGAFLLASISPLTPNGKSSLAAL